MNVGKRLVYTGQVQGVGFRYTAQRLAQGFPVAGSVRNLRDGAVELIVEGEPEQVDAYLAAVAARMAGNIEHTQAYDEAPAGRQGFHIRH